MTISEFIFEQDYSFFFNQVTGFEPYRYQRRVAAALLGQIGAFHAGLHTETAILQTQLRIRLPETGLNVLLQAPTGAGKTWSVVAPFVYARVNRIPIADRLIYALPLRSLAEDLFESTRESIARVGLAELCPVRLQTGETGGISNVGDPNFSEGRIIFCTIDQVLSSYLSIPFSLPPSQSNLNAGAVVGSLIVFDEFHLLDPLRSLRTALLLSTHLSPVSRFVWMTATQAGKAADRISGPDRLAAAFIKLSEEEIAEIPNQHRKRRVWIWQPQKIEASNVFAEHQKLPERRKRSLVICNTVGRAQRMFIALFEIYKEKGIVNPPIVLLHSRFLAEHRKEKIKIIKRIFGKGSSEEGILIATQVVEAGLDLSASFLHTDLAPANALVQRAGRCARFEGEEDGSVFVYDTADGEGGRDYRPYARIGKKHLRDGSDCEKIVGLAQAINLTASELVKLNGTPLTFYGELRLIDSAHAKLDLEAIGSFDEHEWRRKVSQAMIPRTDRSNYALASDLIRDVDSVSIFLSDEQRLNDPLKFLAPRYSPVSISLPRASVAATSAKAAEILSPGTWALKAPFFEETERGDGFSHYATIANAGQDYGAWIKATYRSGPLVMNPSLARYTKDVGLELGVPSGPGDWQSTGSLNDRDLEAKLYPDRKYRAETFQEHIAWVRLHAELLCGDESARERLSYHWRELNIDEEGFQLTDHSVALGRTDACYELPSGTSASLAILAASLHDLGKLTISWQDAVWNWQTLKASRRENYPKDVEGDRAFVHARRLIELRSEGHPVLLAHTDYDSTLRWLDGRKESQIEREFKRPYHALEGSWLALIIVANHLDPEHRCVEGLAKCVLGAIGKHHTPTVGLLCVDRNDPLPCLDLAPGAVDVLRSFLQTYSEDNEAITHQDWEDFLKSNIRLEFRPGASWNDLDDWTMWPLLMLLARIVRLADQRGTRIGSLR